MSFEELVKQGLEVGSQLGPAAGVAALVAALLILAFGWPWQTPRPIRARVGGAVSVGLGFAVGCWWLGIRPNWPPQEDQDRLLFILFPAVIVVEIVAALIESKIPYPKPQTTTGPKSYDRALDLRMGALVLVMLLRFLVAGAAMPILLHNTVYTSYVAGPGTRLWTTEREELICVGLTMPVIVMWILLAWLMDRAPGRGVLVSLAIPLAGTSVVMMMSGYASGGPLAMPLAGAVVGAVAASMALKNGAGVANNILGLALVGLFSLLIIGHFFGVLTWTNAALLFFAPVLSVLPELPSFRRVNARLRACIGVVLTTIPVVVAIGLAQQKMAEQSPRPSSGETQEPTLEDYMNFGK